MLQLQSDLFITKSKNLYFIVCVYCAQHSHTVRFSLINDSDCLTLPEQQYLTIVLQEILLAVHSSLHH